MHTVCRVRVTPVRERRLNIAKNANGEPHDRPPKREVAAARAWLLKPSLTLPLDGRVEFHQALVLRVPTSPGVYLLHDLPGTLYLRCTRDLRHRLDNHSWGSANPLLTQALAEPVGTSRFGWLLVPIPEHWQVEKRLIRRFRPVCNRMSYTNLGEFQWHK